jgi:hypothetical protein
MSTSPYPVTAEAMRPASSNRECFYCKEPVGGRHKPDCVLILKKVKVRLTIEYDIEVPDSWDDYMVEFSRNDGSWCADNLIGELERLRDSRDCLCGVAHFKYLADTSGPFLRE